VKLRRVIRMRDPRGAVHQDNLRSRATPVERRGAESAAFPYVDFTEST